MRSRITPAHRRRALSITAITVAVVAVSLAGASAANATSRVAYGDSVPNWAIAQNDAGAVSAYQTYEGEVFLPLRDQRGAEDLAKQVSTPGLPGYRKPLTPAQWIQRFSPSQAFVDAVAGYLKAAGLTVTGVPASREYLVFRGTASRFGSAFGTSMHTFSYKGKKLVAPTSAPSLPSRIAAKVSGVSLEQTRTLTRPDSVRPGGATEPSSPSRMRSQDASDGPVIDTPCSQYIGERTVTIPAAYGQTKYSTHNCGYTPKQLRSAYGLSNYLNGGGQKVAIVGAYASPSIVQDVNTYAQQNGEPGLTASTYQQIVPKPSEFRDQDLCGSLGSWQTEQTIDVQAVHSIAPAASILYVGATDCMASEDIALSTILDNKLANIVSSSYSLVGETLSSMTIQGMVNLHLQAAGEGIGLYYASGDDGDQSADLGYPAPQFPASSPWVTSVGGTSLAIDSKGSIAWETGWGGRSDQIVENANGRLALAEPLPGRNFDGGAGGGASALFREPDYQSGVVPPSLSRGFRVSADIAALADPLTGIGIGIRPIVDEGTLATGAYNNQVWGGTSVSAPIVAAQIAIVQQASGNTVGFANPTLYAFERVVPRAFRDIVPQSTPHGLVFTKADNTTYLTTLDQDTSLQTAKGYDPVTGLGDISFSLFGMAAQSSTH